MISDLYRHDAPLLSEFYDMGVTYCDDIQDAEETVDAVSGVNFLHHAFFAILTTERRHESQSARQKLNCVKYKGYTFILKYLDNN